MQGAHFFRYGQRPPAFLGQSDAVFPGNRTAPGDDLIEQLIQSCLATPFGAGLFEINHDVGVDVAVAGVAETGHREAVLSLEARGEGEEVFQAATGDNDILVELGKPGIAQSVRELAPNLPDGFAFVLPEADFDKEGLLGRDEFLELTNLAAHGAFLAIELYDEVGPAAPQALAPSAFESGGKRERIGKLQCSRQKASG